MKKILLIHIIAFAFCACNTIKHSSDSDFSKMKYHPHFKKIKSTDETQPKINQNDAVAEVKNEVPEEITSSVSETKQKTNHFFNTEEKDEKRATPAIMPGYKSPLKKILHVSRKNLSIIPALKREKAGIAKTPGSNTDIENIIWTIIGLLILVWLLGLIFEWGNLINILLVIILILLIINLIKYI